MMYLVKIEMNKNNPMVRHALADCQQMHRLLTGIFETDQRILYRTTTVENKLLVYLEFTP